MTKHVGVLAARRVAVDKVDGGQDVPVGGGKELEHGAVLPPNDYASVDEGDGGRNALAAHLLGDIGNRVLQVPEGKSGVFCDSSEGIVESVEIKGTNSLWERC